MSSLLATLICWAFFFILIGGGVFGFLTSAKPLKLPDILQDLKDDKIQLGYIDEVTPSVEITDGDELSQLKKQVEILKLRKQLEQLKDECSSPTNNPTKKLMADCTEALVSLGVPKRKARAEADVVMQSNSNIKTVKEFITEYGKR